MPSDIVYETGFIGIKLKTVSYPSMQSTYYEY